MKVLNRSAVSLQPTQAFYEWLKEVGADSDISADQLLEHGSCYLLPELESDDQLSAQLSAQAYRILANELGAWCEDEALWPDTLDLDLLQRWFNVNAQVMCFDIVEQALLVADIPEVL